MAGDILTALCRRRSCRAFLPDPVSRQVIEAILDAARWAPSGGNLQPWRVIAVTGSERDEVVRIAGEALFSGASEEGEHFIYPPDLWEPYRTRRFANAEALYAALGVSREDKAARYRWVAENFRFFGAPIGLFFIIDRRMGHGQWAQLGMFMQSVALAAEAEGLGTCLQEAWARVRETLHGQLGLEEHELLYCGMALGWPDPGHASASMVRERAALEEIAEFRGFGD
ncbi:nitroreductase [Sphingomonas sp. LHG3406-1]|uniref:nitroreductase n=1 Tax=Sphingomonas sp. LHG3406-1 TaxID=2804617 RepID=UPI00260CBEB2|nr:nitroreductase [Sphingomonas sp. LHG3406-1]